MASSTDAIRECYNLFRAVLGHPLASRDPMGAFTRIARWQILARIKETIVIPWVNGTKLSMSRGMTGASGNYYFGLHEVEDMAFVAHLLRRGDTFVDAGANVGTYTVLASSVGARVHAFEPAPETIPRLEKNVRLNQSDAVLHEVALGKTSGKARFTHGGDCVNQLSATGESQVDIRSLDSFELRPIAIKMDLEGGEENALAGCEQTLLGKELLALQVETVSDRARAMITAAGFKRRWYDPFARELRARPCGNPHNELWIRDESIVAARLAQGGDVKLRGKSLLGHA